jgi:hypothetical protein
LLGGTLFEIYPEQDSPAGTAAELLAAFSKGAALALCPGTVVDDEVAPGSPSDSACGSSPRLTVMSRPVQRGVRPDRLQTPKPGAETISVNGPFAASGNTNAKRPLPSDVATR